MIPARRVVFVCAGNICRSALAMHAFRRVLVTRGIANIDTTSFGLVAIDGDVPRPKTIRAADAAGLDLRAHVARRLHAHHLQHGDHVFVMERAQVDGVRALASPARTIATLGSLLPSPLEDIADPEDGDNAVFDACVARILACVEALADLG
jgi:protein-tyrosine phosphatase